MWPVRGFTGGNSQSRKDILRLGSRRVRRCAQMVREAASGERNLAAVLAALALGGPCQQCVEALLRLVEVRGFEVGATAGLELAEWVREFIHQGSLADQILEHRVRAEVLCAYYLRYADIEGAGDYWRTAVQMAPLPPAEVARMAEHLLQRQVRPQNVLSVYLRWLWSLAVGEEEGLSWRVRRRLDGVRAALIADGRYLEAMRVLLDGAWIDAHRGPYRPVKQRWTEEAGELLRLGGRAGVDEPVLGHWSQACAAGWISSELAEKVFRDLRGLPPAVAYRSITLY